MKDESFSVGSNVIIEVKRERSWADNKRKIAKRFDKWYIDTIDTSRNETARVSRRDDPKLTVDIRMITRDGD